ncbi:MAG TPA: hypothetical protein VF115_10465 [Acidimicrobiia bacterium]
MPELPRFRDLVAEALTDHGRATADVLRKAGRGETIDVAAETAQCLGDLAQTGARFFLFWDNIATLLAAEGGEPLTFPKPRPCPPGEKRKFALRIRNVGTPTVQSGLRRRGEQADTIEAKAITAQVVNGEVTVEVDCGGATRGLYEGKLAVVDADGNQVTRTYNVYIDPGA